jgi:hypothetical protein
MVTTRAMSRQSHKGGSVFSSSSLSNAVLQSEAAVNLETELRIAATTFPPFQNLFSELMKLGLPSG